LPRTSCRRKRRKEGRREGGREEGEEGIAAQQERKGEKKRQEERGKPLVPHYKNYKIMKRYHSISVSLLFLLPFLRTPFCVESSMRELCERGQAPPWQRWRESSRKEGCPRSTNVKRGEEKGRWRRWKGRREAGER